MSPKTSTSVRATPTFIEAARRKQILEAAVDTIAEIGFANASLAQIAKRAGISKSVIGYYFPSKDDLVKAVVENFYLTGHEEMMEHLKTATNATEMLRRYIRQNMQYIADNRVGTRAVGEIAANFRTPEGEPVYRLQDSELMVQGTAAMFDWGQQAGEFRKHDSRVMAVMLRGAMDNFSMYLGAYPDLDVEHYIAEVTELFVRAAAKTT